MGDWSAACMNGATKHTLYPQSLSEQTNNAIGLSLHINISINTHTTRAIQY